MQYRPLGRTGLRVSEIGHGLWGMGDWTDAEDQQSMQALQRSLELGCNFYDTAWVYGDGHSELLLGRLRRDNPEAEIIVATKIPPKNWQWPATADYAIEDVYPVENMLEYTQRSLENLGMDKLHLQQLHVWDDSWAESDVWKEGVERLKAEGLIEHFGLSLNRWEPWNGIEAMRTGLIDAVQVIYNIFDQAPEDELFPLCEEMNIGVLARVPLDEGGLSGKLTKETSFPEGDWRRGYFGPQNLGPTVERAEALKARVPEGMDLPEMALRFILANPVVSTTIPGMRKLPHVGSNIATSDGQGLPADLIDQLREHRWDRKVAPWSD